MGGTAKRREQLAEILAEGEAPPAPILASHAALLDEIAALVDAGKMPLLSSVEVHASLMAVAQANLRASVAKPSTTRRAAAKAPERAHGKRRRSPTRKSR